MSDDRWVERVKPYLGSLHELDRLWNEHWELEEQLAALDKIRWLTPQQDRKRKRLQKQKLAGKDRMIELAAELASQHGDPASSAAAG